MSHEIFATTFSLIKPSQGRVLNHEKKIGEECDQNFYFNWERDLSFTLPKKRFIIYTVACQENRMLGSG